VQLHGSIEVRAPAALVFGVISAPERLPQWNPSVLEARRVGGDTVGMGARAAMRGTVLGQTLESESQVVSFEPPGLFATQGIRGPRLRTTFVLESVASGTRVQASVEGDVPGGMLGGFVAERVLRADFERSLQQLRDLCEAEARQAAAAEPTQGGDPACWAHLETEQT
jgi:hypothetical protein